MTAPAEIASDGRSWLPWAVALPLALGVLGYAQGPLDVGGRWFLEFHPLVMTFRPDVILAPGAWVDAAERWAQLALLLGLAWSLRPRLLGVAVAVCWLLVSPLWGAMWPLEVQWGLLIAAAIARWKGHHGVTGLLLGASVFADSLLAYGVVVQYGLRVAPLGPLLAFGGAAIGAILLLRAGGRWLVALPPLGATTVFLCVLSTADAIEQHRFTPPAPGECDALDVEILHPVERPGERFLPYGVAVGRDLVAVSGDGLVALFDVDGDEVARLDAGRDFGRIEQVEWQGDDLLANPAGATMRWQRTPSGEWDVARSERWGEGFPEILGIAVHRDRAWFSTVDYPILMREEPPAIVYVGGNTSGFTGFVRSIDDRLLLTDSHSVRVLDPDTLETLRFRRFAAWDVAVRHNAGPKHLYRMGTVAGRVEVIDPQSLETVRSIPVDLRPRYMGVSGDERHLLATDFFNGRVHLLDGETGALLGEYSVGRRPRNIAWSERDGAFLGVSACGLYRLRPPG